MVDIFKEADENVMPKWMKFTNAGDSVQGTYVGKIVGQIDGYGNEQVIYQLLQDDGTIVNVGFGLNKKFLISDMEQVKFGQIVGFKYKGKVQVKDKFGKMISVNDFAIHQDPKIVNAKWLEENKNNMPEVTRAINDGVSKKEGFGAFDSAPKDEAEDQGDVPFPETETDKLMIIEKLAKEKLGATDSTSIKELVMTATSIAFIPVNYAKIIEVLRKM